MNDQATSPGCPDFETLSAFFDGEFIPDEALRRHASQCPACAARLAECAAIHSAVSSAAASEPAPDFNARISAFVRTESAKLPVSPGSPNAHAQKSNTAWALRIAALFLLAGFFVFLLFDNYKSAHQVPPVPHAAARSASVPSAPVIQTASGLGSFVRARSVPSDESAKRYAIDIDPALVPSEYVMIPSAGRLALPAPALSGSAHGAPKRIIVKPDAGTPDGMLEAIRRDLCALEVPGISVAAERRGESLFTTIRIDSSERFALSVMRTGEMLELLLMPGEEHQHSEPLSLELEFFCE